MLQPDAPAVIEKGLKVLIVIMKLVLDGKDRFDEIGVLRGGALLEFLHIREITQPVGDGAFGSGTPSSVVIAT